MRLYPFRPHKYRTAAPRNRTFHERYSPISQSDTKRKNPLWDKHSRNTVGRQCFCRNTQTMRTIAVIKRDKCPSIGPYRHTRIPIQCTAEIPSIGQSPPAVINVIKLLRHRISLKGRHTHTFPLFSLLGIRISVKFYKDSIHHLHNFYFLHLMVGYIPYGRFILRRIAGHRNPLLFIPYTLLHQPPFDRHIETSQHGSIGPIAHILTCIIENEFHRTILIRANNIFTIIALYSKIRVYTLEQGRYAVGIIGIMCVDQFILFIGTL